MEKITQFLMTAMQSSAVFHTPKLNINICMPSSLRCRAEMHK